MSEISGFDDCFEKFCSQMQRFGEYPSWVCHGAPPPVAKVVTQLNLQGVISEVQVSLLSSPFVPAATQKNTPWSVND